MKRFFIALLLVAAALTVATAPAGAVAMAENNTTTEPTTAQPTTQTNTTDARPPSRSNASDCGTVVDYNTRICSASFDGTTTTVVIYSDVRQPVTISDAGSFAAGGEVPQRQVMLEQGRNRVSISSERYRGTVGVAIETRTTLYAHYVDRGGLRLIGGTFTRSDAQLAALGGAIGASLVIVYRGFRYAAADDAEPERVA
jgi:hypothetical protein